MSKFIAIALLFLIPLQFSWAMASQYCSHHEQGQAAQHFGHHTDEHHFDLNDHQQSHELVNVDDGQLDDSHHHLHHGVSLGLITFWFLPNTHELSRDGIVNTENVYASRFVLDRIERPQWLHLA